MHVEFVSVCFKLCFIPYQYRCRAYMQLMLQNSHNQFFILSFSYTIFVQCTFSMVKARYFHSFPLSNTISQNLTMSFMAMYLHVLPILNYIALPTHHRAPEVPIWWLICTDDIIKFNFLVFHIASCPLIIWIQVVFFLKYTHFYSSVYLTLSKFLTFYKRIWEYLLMKAAETGWVDQFTNFWRVTVKISQWWFQQLRHSFKNTLRLFRCCTFLCFFQNDIDSYAWTSCNHLLYFIFKSHLLFCLIFYFK